jgi:hypothetical protein
MRMRNGKLRSAIVIVSRGLPGIFRSFFVLTIEHALGVRRGVNAKICREADTDRSWPLVAPGVRPISRA